MDLFDTLIARVAQCCQDRPRNLQVAIGPSAIGEPCSRALIADLMRVERKPEKPNWRAEVGTAVHAYLEPMFSGLPGYLTEKPVRVGHLGGVPVLGSCDLFHIPTGTVTDWKTKSKTTLAWHRRHGPGERYIVQAQLYGLGMVALGYRVTRVMIVFLPRDGELRDAFGWEAPFDPLVGMAAMTRAESLLAFAQTFGVDVAQSAYPACDSEWCRTCGDPNKIYPGRARVASADNPFALNF